MAAAPVNINTCLRCMSRIMGAKEALEYAISLLKNGDADNLKAELQISPDPDLPDTPEPEYVTETFVDLKIGK